VRAVAVRVVIKPCNGTLEVRVVDMAVKLRALRVVVEVGGSVAEITPAGNAVKLRTPSGEHYLTSVEVGVADFFSVEDRPPEVIIRNALYVY
jgi:gamma-glutamyl:cysteine ligase YbdK (ATP-grasp superfamily)